MSTTPSRDSPFKGLEPYDEADAPFFFGREVERELIVANLVAARLTLLYGPSGVGKSSVLSAGVAHQLRSLAHQNMADAGVPDLAVINFRSWSSDNLGLDLSSSIQQAVTDLLGGDPLPLPPAALPLADMLAVWSERLDGDLLIIFDQFEELFVYLGRKDGAARFAREFPTAVNRRGLRAHFLIAIREDALAKLDYFKGSIPQLFDNYLRLDHLDREAARAALVGPIDQYNRVVTTDQPISIEPELIEAVLHDLLHGQAVDDEARPSGKTDGIAALPSESHVEAAYLQVVMIRLWREERSGGSRALRLETLHRLGGADRIFREHLDAAVARLLPKEQSIAARSFRYLVTTSGAKIAYTVADLADVAELDPHQLAPVIDKLAGPGRILRAIPSPPGHDGAPRYEIFHDVLAEAIRDWRLRYELAQKQAAEVRRLAQRQRVMVRNILAGAAALVLLLAALAAPTLRRQWLRVEASRLNRLVPLAGGTATIGADAPGRDSSIGERGLSRIPVGPFSIQEHEVTNQEYGLCLAAGACPNFGSEQEITSGDPLRARYPVVGINAFQASAYCRWLGGRLPSDVEWERTARGLDGSPWPWGRQAPSPELANIQTEPPRDTRREPVETHPAGKSLDGGVQDLIGNVAEWTSTTFPCDAIQCPWDGTGGTDAAPILLYLRGGSWDEVIRRVTFPRVSPPGYAERWYGFRCAQ